MGRGHAKRAREDPRPPLVEELEPRILLSTFTVTSAADAGAGSLRQAILDANANPGLDTIAFDVGGGGAQTLRPTSALPTVSDAVVIDGTTQPGFAGTPLIELDGSFAGRTAIGLHLTGGDSTIRGLVINRFGDDGILIESRGGNRIVGNWIGTDATGTLDRGNRDDGIEVRTADNLIGGTDAADRNVISGNDEDGVDFDMSAADGNVLIGNFIGTDRTGTLAIGNTDHGVNMERGSASRNVVGRIDPGAGNVIAHNGAAAVSIKAGVQNQVRGNAIFGTPGLGIDLNPPGVAANDPGDGDNGANLQQNNPVLSSAANVAGGARIVGTLDSTPGGTFALDFYANASSVREGRTYLGSATVATDGAGLASFDVTVAGSLAPGEYVTATATDAAGNTSEFGAPLAATFASPPSMTVNTLAIAEGGMVALSGSELAATDPDTDPATLTFTVSGVTAGRFERAAAPGTPITSFTQAEVTAGAIRFVHDGSELAPAYAVTVSDGALADGPSAAAITFTPVNDPPALGANALAIAEGGTVVLSGSELAATDPDTDPATLTFTVSGVTAGRFERAAAPGTAITSFTQAEVTAGAIRFVHDGSELAPAYAVTVSDGALADGPSAAAITFTPVNDAPILASGTFVVSASSPAGALVGRMSWQDAEPGSSYRLRIVSGDSDGAFSIDDGGALRVQDPSALGTGPFVLQVRLEDGALSATAEVVILVELPEDAFAALGARPLAAPAPAAETPAPPAPEVAIPDVLLAPAGGSEPAAPEPTPRWEAPGALVRPASAEVEALAPPPLEEIAREAERARAALPVSFEEALERALERFGRELLDGREDDARQELVFSAITTASALALSAGVLTYLLRAGSLVAGLLASLPVWHRLDVLAVLALSERERKERAEAQRREARREEAEQEVVARIFGSPRDPD